MKAGWEVKALGDVVRLEYGKPLPDIQRKPDGRYAVYGANGEKTRSDSFYAKGPSLIIGRKGSAGEINVADDDFWPLDVTYFTEHDPTSIEFGFLRHAVSILDLPSMARGVKPGINRNDVYALPIPLPPLDEQKRIVEVLDAAFEGLTRARAHTETNLQSARELFESFAREVIADCESQYEARSLAAIADNLDRRRVPITKGDRVAGNVPYYGASGIVDYVAGHLFDEELLLVSEDGANLLARSTPIAFSISGKTWVNNHAHILRFSDRNVQEFVSLYLNSISIAPFVSGMAQPKLNQQELNRIPIPLPDPAACAEIVSKAEALKSETADLQSYCRAKLADLDDLRRSLLQKAFAGELT